MTLVDKGCSATFPYNSKTTLQPLKSILATPSSITEFPAPDEPLVKFNAALHSTMDAFDAFNRYPEVNVLALT